MLDRSLAMSGADDTPRNLHVVALSSRRYPLLSTDSAFSWHPDSTAHLTVRRLSPYSTSKSPYRMTGGAGISWACCS